MSEADYRQSARGQASAILSARLLAAQGAGGETPDGLTSEQRDATAACVGAEVSGYVDAALSKDGHAVAYVAVGSSERMLANLNAAMSNGGKGLVKCEVFRTVLCPNPYLYLLDKASGSARRFTSALLYEVCAEPSLLLTQRVPASHPPTQHVSWQELKQGHITAFVSEKDMASSYTAKASEVDSHTHTIGLWGYSRMLMRGVSKGGPKQGVAGGYALGAYVAHCGNGPSARYLTPEISMSTRPASESPAFRQISLAMRRQIGLAGLKREREAASSSSAATSSTWSRRFVCTEMNPKDPSSRHNKYWTAEFEEENATLTYTWGGLTHPVTNRLVLSFGSAHQAIASALGMQKCATKLRSTKKKAPYSELQHDDPLELPSLEFRRVGLRLQGAQSAPESFDFDAYDYEPESDDEDDVDDEVLMDDWLGDLADGL